MKFTNSVSDDPVAPEAVISQVRRQLSRDPASSAAKQRQDVDRVVETAVRELWPGRVKTFVPVLALREAREFLREQSDGVATAPLETESRTSAAHEVSRDAMSLDSDVLILDAEDVLRF